MTIISTDKISDLQKQAIFTLWNNEYPHQLTFTSMQELDSYLSHLNNQTHYFALDVQNEIQAWAFSFDRDNEKWFAIIVKQEVHKTGIGKILLNALQAQVMMLNGWVIEHNDYLKKNGEKFITPLHFYLKNDFKICQNKRLETEHISAVKINWTKEVKRPL